MKVHRIWPILLLAAVAFATPPGRADGADDHPDLQVFVDAASSDEKKSEAALALLAPSWRDSYTVIFVDLARFMRPRQEAR
jgi:hypothetical protein